MSAAKWTNRYGIHHWRILWSSYRKLAVVRLEPVTSEFQSEALTDWARSPWVQLTLSVNFIQALQFDRFFSVTFRFSCCLPQSPRLFWSKFSWRNHMSVTKWTDTYDIHHWTILWSSYRKLASVGFQPTALNSVQML